MFPGVSQRQRVPCMAAQPWPGWEQRGSVGRVSGEGTAVATPLGASASSAGLHVDESKPSCSDWYVSNIFSCPLLAWDIECPQLLQPARNQLVQAAMQCLGLSWVSACLPSLRGTSLFPEGVQEGPGSFLRVLDFCPSDVRILKQVIGGLGRTLVVDSLTLSLSDVFLCPLPASRSQAPNTPAPGLFLP